MVVTGKYEHSVNLGCEQDQYKPIIGMDIVSKVTSKNIRQEVSSHKKKTKDRPQQCRL